MAIVGTRGRRAWGAGDDRARGHNGAQDVRGREGVTLLPFPCAAEGLALPRCRGAGRTRWAVPARGGVRRSGRALDRGPEGRGEGRSASEIMARSFAAAGQNKSLLLHVWHAQVEGVLRHEPTVD